MAIYPIQFFIYLLTVALLVLPGCASKGHSTSGVKFGMHIDAVLEFVVEYPLKWKKDRRLDYGRNEGEIRWRDPTQSETLLQITSYLREYRTNDQALGRVLNQYPDLIEAQREQVELPAGKAWHVKGETAHQHIEIYLFLEPSRTYVISLKSSAENFAGYEDLMEKLVQSFQRIAQ